MTVIRPRRALISVSDKQGLIPLAQALAGHGVALLSTGGSARALADAGLTVTQVSDHTGFPEIMDGRVKTLHPKIHGGLLARRDLDSHTQAQAEHGIADIDLLVVTLYPFEAMVAAGAGFAACVENIDIGGPALIRAAAKNHDFVAVVTDPADYPALLSELAERDGGLTLETRRRLAGKAYARTASYDAAIARWMAGDRAEGVPLTLAAEHAQTLRYGENPHQGASLYRGGGPARPGVLAATQLQGKALSFNNINDTDAAFELVAEFDAPSVAIIKHANPCGVASAATLADAYAAALSCDTTSAFGGIVAVNRPLDGAAAQAMAELFLEVIIAPGFTPDARAALAGKANLRLLDAGAMPDPSAPGPQIRSVAGGLLVQDRDAGRIDPARLVCVTRRQPDGRELADLVFAFRVAKHVKSNAIVYARDGATVGIGAGQMSRVDSARTAVRKAADMAEATGAPTPRTRGSVVASDAFFPFADGLLAAAESGVTAVIQPGGSVRDQEVIAAADENGLAMVFTGMRHFRH